MNSSFLAIKDSEEWKDEWTTGKVFEEKSEHVHFKRGD